jgi:hypothetical protein
MKNFFNPFSEPHFLDTPFNSKRDYNLLCKNPEGQGDLPGGPRGAG